MIRSALPAVAEDQEALFNGLDVGAKALVRFPPWRQASSPEKRAFFRLDSGRGRGKGRAPFLGLSAFLFSLSSAFCLEAFANMGQLTQ